MSKIQIDEFQKKINSIPGLPYLSKASAREILITRGIIKPRVTIKPITIFPPDIVFGEAFPIEICGVGQPVKL